MLNTQTDLQLGVTPLWSPLTAGCPNQRNSALTGKPCVRFYDFLSVSKLLLQSAL